MGRLIGQKTTLVERAPCSLEKTGERGRLRADTGAGAGAGATDGMEPLCSLKESALGWAFVTQRGKFLNTVIEIDCDAARRLSNDYFGFPSG
jgi:hypothetical protein